MSSVAEHSPQCPRHGRVTPVPRRGDEHHFLTLAAAGTGPLCVQSVFLWGSQGGTACPFSWCIPQWLQPSLDWGKWHKVSYDHPNQTATSSTGADPGPESALSPSWGSGVGGDSLGWGKKLSASICGGGTEMGRGPFYRNC